MLNWFEGGGGAHKCNGEIEEAREFAKWVKKWWQEERNGELERRGSLRWEGETEEETWERWRKLEKSLVSKLAVRVVVSPICASSSASHPFATFSIGEELIQALPAPFSRAIGRTTSLRAAKLPSQSLSP